MSSRHVRRVLSKKYYHPKRTSSHQRCNRLEKKIHFFIFNVSKVLKLTLKRMHVHPVVVHKVRSIFFQTVNQDLRSDKIWQVSEGVVAINNVYGDAGEATAAAWQWNLVSIHHAISFQINHPD